MDIYYVESTIILDNYPDFDEDFGQYVLRAEADN